MKISFIVPASITGTKAQNYAYPVKNFFQIWKHYRKAKKLQASSFYIFFPSVKTEKPKEHAENLKLFSSTESI